MFHLGRATLFADPPPIRFASTLPTFDIDAVADLRCSGHGALELTSRQANPRNTANARVTASIVISSRCPKVSPTFPRGTVCVLSTIT